MAQIKLNRPIALGNGDRKAGEVLGSCPDVAKAVAAVFEAAPSELGAALKKAKVKAAKGVTERELICALRNSQFLAGPAELPEQSSTPPAPDAWKQTALAALQVSDDVRGKLAAANLATAGQIQEAADAGTLAATLGGDDQLAAVLEALEAVQK